MCLFYRYVADYVFTCILSIKLLHVLNVSQLLTTWNEWITSVLQGAFKKQRKKKD